MNEFNHSEEPDGLFGLPDYGNVAENRLLVGSETEVADACSAHIRDHQSESGGLILVTFNDSSDSHIHDLEDSETILPSQVVVICVGWGAHESASNLPGVDLTAVTDPRDLPRLGITISDALGPGEDELTPTLCFRSLGTLLQSVELERAFRFLHTLRGKVNASGVRAHYHLDPAIVDEHVVSTLEPLFDSVTDCGNQVIDEGGDDSEPRSESSGQPSLQKFD